MSLDPNLPSIEHLRERGRKRVPPFTFEYLDNGCHSNLNMRRNTDELREVRLEPRYVLDYGGAELETELFGETYAAPFGVAPIGLQGLVWPGACEFLAEAAHAARVPFILSTVGTASIERVSEITEGKAWFQLYHPTEDELRSDRVRARPRGRPRECPSRSACCDENLGIDAGSHPGDVPAAEPAGAAFAGEIVISAAAGDGGTATTATAIRAMPVTRT